MPFGVHSRAGFVGQAAYLRRIGRTPEPDPYLGGGGPHVRVLESADLTQAFALVFRTGSPVLVIKTGVLEQVDCRLLCGLLGLVAATADPSLASLGIPMDFAP